MRRGLTKRFRFLTDVLSSASRFRSLPPSCRDGGHTFWLERNGSAFARPGRYASRLLGPFLFVLPVPAYLPYKSVRATAPLVSGAFLFSVLRGLAARRVSRFLWSPASGGRPGRGGRTGFEPARFHGAPYLMSHNGADESAEKRRSRSKAAHRTFLFSRSRVSAFTLAALRPVVLLLP